MRDKYFLMFSQIKLNQYYYWEYKNTSEKIVFWCKLVFTTISFSSIIAAFIENRFPTMWLWLLGISQTYQAINHLLPFEERVVHLNFFMPELDKLLIEIKSTWNNIGSLTDEQIASHIKEYNQRYIDIEHKYIGSISFPLNVKIDKKANARHESYFKYHF